MNRNLFTVMLVMIGHCSFGQNTFPTSGNVGIGTLYPVQPLDVVGNVLLRNMVNESGGGASLSFSSYSDDNPGPRIRSYLDFAYGADSKSRLILSSYYNGYKDELTLMNGNVGIGTLYPNDKLSVNGNIRAKEIKVELTGWSDFVFAKDYQLPSLSEIEAHINKNGHLPGIPSAAEVKNNGIDLGEMNAKLLQKIEELTLYLIDLKKENKSQRKDIEFLKSKIK